jgi:hypothetical protein
MTEQPQKKKGILDRLFPNFMRDVRKQHEIKKQQKLRDQQRKNLSLPFMRSRMHKRRVRKRILP